MKLGYCCNVHPGNSVDQLKDQLQQHSLAIKGLVAPDAPLPVGLWFSASAAAELQNQTLLLRFRDWLQQVQLLPFTLNGFPFGDFHSPVVKHQVYLPGWDDPARQEYTLQLAEILVQLLPPGEAGTISTVPVGWPESPAADSIRLAASGRNLMATAEALARLEERTGVRIALCLEPEPGCLLDSASDVLDFFQDQLSPADSLKTERNFKYLQVCHDVCHSAVMFEGQADCLQAYQQAGIKVGKLQVSSALSVDFDRMTVEEKKLAVEQLRQFAEPRYLHQLVWKREDKPCFFEDLPQALDQLGPMQVEELSGVWRIHFHVPIFADRLGLLGTTQQEILQCLAAMQRFGSTPEHLEIETYAWNVLPADYQPVTLAAGIAEEYRWLNRWFQAHSAEL